MLKTASQGLLKGGGTDCINRTKKEGKIRYCGSNETRDARGSKTPRKGEKRKAKGSSEKAIRKTTERYGGERDLTVTIHRREPMWRVRRKQTMHDMGKCQKAGDSTRTGTPQQRGPSPS